MNTKLRDSIDYWKHLVGIVGLRSTLRLLLIRAVRKLGRNEPEMWSARPRQVRHVLTARLRGSSDMSVFHQIFMFEEYSVLGDLENVSLVLDLGANVGFSAAYFLNCFPKTRVVAVEPDGGNLTVCKVNLNPYGDRALLLHGAAWSECTRLNLSTDSFGDGREWARQVSKPPDDGIGEVQAWDVGTLIDMAGGTVVDLLKVDIERGELSVFGESASRWLTRIRNICIELHGPDCEEVFFRAIADFDYELGHSGELTICRNLRPKAAADGSPGKKPQYA
jgi:FkbM family methyltransferase